jgi:hypothetical protein
MGWWMMVLALAGAIPPGAERDISVAADEVWKHAGTGLVLMPQLGSLPRTALTDATPTERDVTARFEAQDKSVSATIYVFHPALADAGVWFDSAQAGLESGQTFRNAVRATADPVSFAVGADRSAASLRQVYSTRRPLPQYRPRGGAGWRVDRQHPAQYQGVDGQPDGGASAGSYPRCPMARSGRRRAATRQSCHGVQGAAGNSRAGRYRRRKRA